MLIYNRNLTGKTMNFHYTYSPVSIPVNKALLSRMRQKILVEKSTLIVRIKRKHIFTHMDRAISIGFVWSMISKTAHFFIRNYTYDNLSLIGNHRSVFDLYQKDYFRSSIIMTPFVFTKEFRDSISRIKHYDPSTFTSFRVGHKYLQVKLGFLGSYIDYHFKRRRRVRHFKGK